MKIIQITISILILCSVLSCQNSKKTENKAKITTIQNFLIKFSENNQLIFEGILAPNGEEVVISLALDTYEKEKIRGSFYRKKTKKLTDLEGIIEDDASVILHQIDGEGNLINVLVGKLKPIDENTVFFEGEMGELGEEQGFEFKLRGKFIN